jgi:acyl carrier protein
VTSDEIRGKVVEILGQVVPELDPRELRADAALRDQLDIDSMDFLNFAIGLHKAFGVEIPEADYRQLATLDGCVAYLAARIKVP